MGCACMSIEIELPDLSRLPELHPEQMLTTEQLAAITGISKQTFEGWRSRKNGGPKFRRLGPQLVRYRWADVCAWRDEQDNQSSAA
jgi:predicted DNA-binding transcriptional regulator AlpA